MYVKIAYLLLREPWFWFLYFIWLRQVVTAGYCQRIYLIEQGSATANLSTDAGHSSV
jgi:hypothetical protein